MGSLWQGVVLLVCGQLCLYQKAHAGPTGLPATPATGSHSGIETVAAAAAAAAAV